MGLLEKLTDLISQVSNEGDETDKRKLIDEVAGMMKSGGCDDELIRTAIAKMEKIGYDKSEDGKADNKKAKNGEDIEDEEKFEEEKEIANKKSKNEEDEDEKEDDKDKEEKASNKCKNSMDEIRKAILGGKSQNIQTGYLTKAQRLELGNKY